MTVRLLMINWKENVERRSWPNLAYYPTFSADAEEIQAISFMIACFPGGDLKRQTLYHKTSLLATGA
jgi:hypothetical protein